MREIESNLRGFRSESGILIENAFSSALSTSGRAKESSRPESKSDSSGSAGMSFFAMVLTISAIWACLFIDSVGSLTCRVGRHPREFVPDFRVLFVIVHEIAEERVAQAPVSGLREMDVIALREA